MRSLAGQVFCGVLLLILNVQMLAGFLAKSGLCPLPLLTKEQCAMMSLVVCLQDADCREGQKCCDNGCGLMCTAPLSSYPNICPLSVPPMNASQCAAYACITDESCPGSQKCCSNYCGGRFCVLPMI